MPRAVQHRSREPKSSRFQCRRENARIVAHYRVDARLVDSGEIAWIVDCPRDDRSTALVRPANRRLAGQRVVKDERGRTRDGESQGRHKWRDVPEKTQPDARDRSTTTALGDPEHASGDGDARADAGLDSCERSHRVEGERAHEAALHEAEPAERSDDVGLPPPDLEIEMQPHLAGLVDEERQDFVERRYVRADFPETLQRPISHGAVSHAVAHLTEIVRVRYHELAVPQIENVELDEIHTCFDCRPEGWERVLGRQDSGAPMTYPQRTPVAPLERDQGSGLVGK